MQADDRDRPILVLTLAAIAAVVGARGFLLAGMALMTTGMDAALETLPWPKTQLMAWAVLGWIGWRIVHDSHNRRLGHLLLVISATVGLTARYLWLSRPDAILDRPMGAERIVGQFPYWQGSTVRYLTLDGFMATATIGDDGTRVCGPPVPAAGRITIATIGDSFIFGMGANDGSAMCDLLRGRLDARLPDTTRVLNLGQPGANIGSYADNARYAIDTLGARVLLVGLTIPDDLNPIDVNDPPWLRHHMAFRLFLAAFDHNIFLQFLAHTQEILLPEAASQAFAWESLRQLRQVADERKIPTGVFIFGDPYLSSTWQIRALEALAADSEHFVFLGEIHAPVDQPTLHIMDRHPTALGNLYFSEQTEPWVTEQVLLMSAP